MSITFNLVPATAAASAVYVEQENVNRGPSTSSLPHKILVPGQYNDGYSPTVNTPQLILNKADAWTRYGRGSMLAAMIEKCLKKGGGCSVYAFPIAANSAGVAATGTVVVTVDDAEAGTIYLYIGGEEVDVAITADMTATEIGEAIADAINANLDLPVTAENDAGTVTLTCRWAGESGNQIALELNRDDDDETPDGVTLEVTDIGSVTAGANDPDLTDVFTTENLGGKWFTEVPFPYTSEDAIGAMEDCGDERDDPSVMRQLVGFVGFTGTIANFITALEERNSQWSTYVPVPGSPTSAYMIAASAAAIYAKYQQINPGRPVKTIELPGVIAGNEAMKDYADTVVQAGGSWTINQDDDTVIIGDLCTTRTTEDSGAKTEDWRFTIIITNIQHKLYQIYNTFAASPFARAVVLTDSHGKGPSYGIRPKTVKGYAIKLVRAWGEAGLSTDIDTIINGNDDDNPGISAEINDSNAGRIDLLIPDIPSAGLRILATKLEWAFTTG
ncbi:MAG: hypothetical protein PQJ46_09420 [Spirochaetales bacterium]|nr:hypothetical protein [Spirochaetales bacterium]